MLRVEIVQGGKKSFVDEFDLTEIPVAKLTLNFEISFFQMQMTITRESMKIFVFQSTLASVSRESGLQ